MPRKKWLLEEALEYRRRNQGVIGIESRVPVRDRWALSLVYTPGVAAPCLEIAKDASLSYVYTGRGRTVGIVTDGSTVYQHGKVGPFAVLPVMEGKAVILKTFAGIEGIPLCLKDQDLEGMVKTLTLLTPSFGAFCVEDVTSPLCFALEERLEKATDLPVLLNHALSPRSAPTNPPSRAPPSICRWSSAECVASPPFDHLDPLSENQSPRHARLHFLWDCPFPRDFDRKGRILLIEGWRISQSSSVRDGPTGPSLCFELTVPSSEGAVCGLILATVPEAAALPGGTG